MMKQCAVKLNWLLRASANDLHFKKVNLAFNHVVTRFASQTNVPGSSEAGLEPAGRHPPSATAEPPLVDSFGRRHDYLRISLTERCNLRCQYCMPAEGVKLCPKSELLTSAEVVRVAGALSGAPGGGVRKVRLTGGEPTLRGDLPALVAQLRALPGLDTVAITTNGLVLTRRLPALHAAGLTHLNVSLDSLRADRYERMARRPGLARVTAGIDLALQLGYSPVKVNTVLIKGFNDDEILDFVELTKDKDIEVRFIEFMPFSGNSWDSSRLVPTAAVREVIARAHAGLRRAAGAACDTARVWRVPGHRGAVGFVSSMTEHFCGGCNRMRLTADGNLKVCLFGNAEVSVRDAVRAGATDAELRDLVRAALWEKKAKHAGEYRRPRPRPRRHRAPALTSRHVPCRHASARTHGEPAHDPHRRIGVGAPARSLPHLAAAGPARAVAVGAPARAYCTLPHLAAAGHARAVAVGAPARAYCTLPHLDAAGHARMVDVGDKPVTRRAAVAQCRVSVSPALLAVLRARGVPKGDALGVARVAGALAAKRTADLLPLCHPLPLSAARVELRLPPASGREGHVLVSCAVRVEARTGAEMEALTGAAVAALAFYDMCKAVDKDMRITDLRLVHKSGGRSDPRAPPPAPSPPPPPAPREADRDTETYAPTNFMYF